MIANIKNSFIAQMQLLKEDNKTLINENYELKGKIVIVERERNEYREQCEKYESQIKVMFNHST